MAASMFPAAAAAARVKLVAFAAESRTAYCSGCMKVATAPSAADFSLHFGASCVADSLCKSSRV